jgi:hypothetical protein
MPKPPRSPLYDGANITHKMVLVKLRNTGNLCEARKVPKWESAKTKAARIEIRAASPGQMQKLVASS